MPLKLSGIFLKNQGEVRDKSGIFGLVKLWQPFKKPVLEVQILWCKTDIYSYNLSKKVSLMIDNLFLVPFLHNLKHISLYYIQNSMKITCK